MSALNTKRQSFQSYSESPVLVTFGLHVSTLGFSGTSQLVRTVFLLSVPNLTPRVLSVLCAIDAAACAYKCTTNVVNRMLGEVSTVLPPNCLSNYDGPDILGETSVSIHGRTSCLVPSSIHFLITYTWDVLNVNAHRMKPLLRTIQRCLNHVFLLEQLKNYQGGENLTQRRWRGPTTWNDMLENALSDTASWQTKKVEQLYKVSSPCLDDYQLKQEELASVGELSKKYAHRLS